jgi:hypothetical protein
MLTTRRPYRCPTERGFDIRLAVNVEQCGVDVLSDHSSGLRVDITTLDGP